MDGRSPKPLLLLLHSLCVIHFVHISAALLNESDLRSLLLSFNGGVSWNTSEEDQPCHWNGVSCDENGQATNLTLSGHNLSGIIPENISLLQPTLLWLDLSSNALTGSIPSGLTQLSNLEYLDLSHNNLQGNIPAEIGNLSSIAFLSVSQNNLTGSIPGSITRLSKLRMLSAYENGLEGPIWFINGSRNLVSVNLASNSLTGQIPSGLCQPNSSALTVLLLSSNKLSGPIPADLASCTSLTTLRVGQNLLDGVIHEDFGLMNSLIYLEADQNQLSGGLPSNIQWHNLSLLNLANNSLSGSIPETLSRATALQEIRLSNNSFSGPIPTNLSHFSRLSVLDLSMNRLSGVIPQEICSSHRLEHLQVGDNLLSGSIPSSIADCSNLLELDLGLNDLSGSIPKEIGSLSNLQVSLNLSWNRLTGSIPSEVGNLHKLVSLDLSHNQLSGGIPTNLENMQSLLDADFSYNQLVGRIPAIKNADNASMFDHNAGLCGPPSNKTCWNDDDEESGSKSSGLSVGKVAGIVLGCTAMVLLMISVIAIVVLRNRYLHSPAAKEDQLTEAVVVVRRMVTEEVERGIDMERIKAAVMGGLNCSNWWSVISKNRFSVVYKAVMPSSGLVVAVKKLIISAAAEERGVTIHQQRKMIGELEKMTKLCHENIMQPVGYYIENELVMIIYDFVPLCSLRQKLHEEEEEDASSLSLSSWSSRYKIALSMAQGLVFLHHSCTPSITHIDLSSNNIYLGPNSQVKLGDVEIAKLLDPSKHTGSISAVAGTVGYIPPEYAFTMRVTLPSNVYSFGVILLELLTGRLPVDHHSSLGDALDLVRWVRRASSRGEMPHHILDSRISSQSQYCCQEMLAVLKIALLCTHDSPVKRPRMKKVLQMLQDVKLQSYSEGL